MTLAGARTSGRTGAALRRGTVRRSVLGAVLVLVLGTGCGDDELPLSAEDRQFIEAVVALRQAAQVAMGDSAEFAVRKASALSSHGVTEDQLRAYIQSHAQDLDRMAAVWESINVRLTVPTTQE
jgi:hypothetical protein